MWGLRTPYQGENTGLEVKIQAKPKVEPVTVQDFKKWAKIDLSEDDDMLDRILKASRIELEAYINQSLITQTVIAYWNTYAQEVPLPRGPVKSITTVERIYNGVSTTLTPTEYETRGLDFKRIVPDVIYASGGRWKYALKVTYQAGYGDTGESVPEDIKEAILKTALSLYDNRENFVVGTIVAKLPNDAKKLVSHRKEVII